MVAFEHEVDANNNTKYTPLVTDKTSEPKDNSVRVSNVFLEKFQNMLFPYKTLFNGKENPTLNLMFNNNGIPSQNLDEVNFETKTLITNLDKRENKEVTIQDETLLASIQRLNEKNKDRPTYETIISQLQNSNLSEKEKMKRLVQIEKSYITEDRKFLEEEFKKNPELRIKYQENFAKLKPSMQKATLSELYHSGRKPDEAEISRLKVGLKEADDDVKTMIALVLRRDNKLTPEKAKALMQELNITQETVAKKLHSYRGLFSANITRNIMEDEKASPKAVQTIAQNLHRHDKSVIETNIDTFTGGKALKENQIARTTFIRTLPQFSEKYQVYATDKTINSDYFNEKDRDLTISQVKEFSAENQAKASSVIIDSKKINENNRNTLATEIKHFDKNIQSGVAEKFSKSEYTSKENLNTLSKESQFFDKKAQLETNKHIQEAIENKERFNEQNNINRDNTLASEIKESELDEMVTEIERKFTPEEKELLESAKININQITRSMVEKNPTEYIKTILQFVEFVARTQYDVGAIFNAGYGNLLTKNFDLLPDQIQERFIENADIMALVEMHTANKIPARYLDKFFSRIEKCGQIDLQTATTLARTADFTKLLELSKSDKFTPEVISLLKETLTKRFPDRYAEYQSKQSILK